MRLLLAFSAIALFAMAIFSSAKAQTVSAQALCDIAANAEAHAGESLTLEGRLFSDFQHASGISSPACPDQVLIFGRWLPDAQGEREFFEAWRVSASCPEDDLLLTATGRIESVERQGRRYSALALAKIEPLRREPGSTCPLTLQEAYERMETAE